MSETDRNGEGMSVSGCIATVAFVADRGDEHANWRPTNESLTTNFGIMDMRLMIGQTEELST